MSPSHPADVHRLFVQLFNAGKLDEVLALYEPGAAFIPQPGQTVRGTDAIREAVTAFHNLGGPMEVSSTEVMEVGDIALLMSKWTLQPAAENAPLLKATTADIVRRQPDGTWRVVLDNPWGTG